MSRKKKHRELVKNQKSEKVFLRIVNRNYSSLECEYLRIQHYTFIRYITQFKSPIKLHKLNVKRAITAYWRKIAMNNPLSKEDVRLILVCRKPAFRRCLFETHWNVGSCIGSKKTQNW